VTACPDPTGCAIECRGYCREPEVSNTPADNQQPSTPDERPKAWRGRRLKDTSKTGGNSGKMLAAGKEPPPERYTVDEATGCWMWDKPMPNGYGQVKYNGRNVGVHRAYYAHYVGPVPHNKVVMHTCDRPACCNPAHLKLGTQKENMADRQAKGRGAGWVNEAGVGSQRANAKLDEDKVREIRRRRAEGEKAKDLAKEFGVSNTVIHFVVTRKSWVHVD
jgi:hypothetical protein